MRYACNWLFRGASAYNLGQEVYCKKLTGIGRYKYCANFEGSLAIYQWAHMYLNNKPFNGGFKFAKRKHITYSMANKLTKEQLIKKINDLEKANKRQQKRIEEMEQINDAQKELIKIYIPKPDKVVIKKIKQQKCASMSWRKFLHGIGINRSTFYLVAKQKELNERDKMLANLALNVWNNNYQIYGREKLLIALNTELLKRGKDPTTDWVLRRIMKIMSIKSIIPHATIKHADKKNTKFKCKNLLKRKFKANRKYEKACTDVTYYPTPSGFIYISTLVDCFDFKPICWNASLSNDNDLVIGSIKPIINKLNNCIIHSDHGYQYSSREYLQLLENHNCKCSMSRIGNSLDNYPVEHHFHFLKYEWLNRIPFEERTLNKVKEEIDKYYKWFINERIQIRKNHKKIEQLFLYNLWKESGPLISPNLWCNVLIKHSNFKNLK